MIITKRDDPWFEIIVPIEWEGLSIERLFREVWKAPKKQTHQLRMNKEVLLNEEPCNWTYGMTSGDRLKVKLFTDKNYGVIPTQIEIQILYEDEHLLVVNKPPGMDTHPNTAEQTNTLANAVAFHLQAKNENCLVKHVHRLDRDTTGAILFAKHSFIGSILDKLLEERKIKRTYIAMVQGILKDRKGTIDAPIGRDRHHPTRRRVSPNGQDALTHYEVVETDLKKNWTMVRCQLDTGRTHQIRVHLSYLGFPLIGDTLYGGSANFHRQALHAEKLEFLHPFTLDKVTSYAPFIDWIEKQL